MTYAYSLTVRNFDLRRYDMKAEIIYCQE